MTCELCENVVERTDIPHVIRTCKGCGREMHIFEPGEHGRGFVIKAGDRAVIPAGFMKMSLNPLHGTGQLTRSGLEWLAAEFFVEGMTQKQDKYIEAAEQLETRMDDIVNSFPPLAGLDINNSSDADTIIKIMQEHKSTREYWAFLTGFFLAVARKAIESQEAERAAWATACSERCRSMVVFKESLEEVAWMGHSAKRIIDILGTWDANRQNADEEFWQLTFNANSYALSQVFAVPMLFLKDKAYVGGMTVDRSDARFVDYLFSTESSREAILIEIKSPTTPLLARTYRGNRPPSKDLAGSVVQVLNYRAELARNLRSITEGTELNFTAFTPRCAVIIGNSETELRDDNARRSFELFRTSLKDVEVITYDELFRKVEILAELFRLKRADSR